MTEDTIKGFCFISSPSSLYPCLNPHVSARNKNFCIIKFLSRRNKLKKMTRLKVRKKNISFPSLRGGTDKFWLKG